MSIPFWKKVSVFEVNLGNAIAESLPCTDE